MSRKRIAREFSKDNRAVSAVIGFILIFGILVLLLTVYQAQIVPQQNAQTEFEHFEDNKNEMIELRNAISDAGQNDFSRFTSVDLGPSYQTRLLGINPAPPAGTLQTHDAPPIKIWNKSEEDPEAKAVSTKFIEYQPGYNELDTGSIWYEHSVLYLDERDRGNDFSIIENQNLVVDSKDNLSIIAIQNDFEKSGADRVTLELYTNTSEVGSLPDDYRILIPTRLDETYWNGTNIPEEAWADGDSAIDPEPDVETYDNFDNVSGLNLTNTGGSELGLDLNSVGIQSAPDSEEDELRNTRVQSGGDVEDEPTRPPPSPTEGELVSVDGSGVDDNKDIRFDIRNDGQEQITEITEITIENDPDNIGSGIARQDNNDDEVEIGDDGALSVQQQDEVEFGETYDFVDDSQGQRGSYASLDVDDEARITLGEFDTDDSDGFERVEVIDDPDDAEDNAITVTLVYQDETGNVKESELYIDAEED